MRKKLLFHAELLSLTIRRLAQELIENHGDFEHTVVLGLQPRGIILAERLCRVLAEYRGRSVRLGYLDATFHRDDFRRTAPKAAYETAIDFSIEHVRVVLVDDVLFTGRTVRAALDAMLAYGRPRQVELLVLVDRVDCREVPIEAQYIGRKVRTLRSQHILIELVEQHKARDSIWMIEKHV